MSMENAQVPGGPMSAFVASAVEYMVDAGQRSVLFLDVMRRRGDQYREHVAQTAPHVLQYTAELIIDGRKLDEPVNYALVRIVPPKGVEIDMKRRPFVVVDPRAGHGPGIGGFKADSEIGVAMKAGHPCYFIGFLPEPMPGQTIERIARAEAQFIEAVISGHPDADPGLRPDHRLYGSRKRRPSRHLCLGRRREKGTCGVLQQYRFDRCAATGPL